MLLLGRAQVVLSLLRTTTTTTTTATPVMMKTRNKKGALLTPEPQASCGRESRVLRSAASTSPLRKQKRGQRMECDEGRGTGPPFFRQRLSNGLDPQSPWIYQ